MDNDKGRYTLVFLAAPDDIERACTEKSPLVELTHNWDPEAYTGGRNFGHLAFVRSPDGISIELLQEGDSLPPAEPWSSMANFGSW